tara:strand:+ start:314 stop:793 length:480 start_codon:yes stop_codon:yes gene_type:complete
MKITQKNLQQIIKEEVRRLLKEQGVAYDEDIPPGEDDGYEAEVTGQLPQRSQVQLKPSVQPKPPLQPAEEDHPYVRRYTDEEFGQMRTRSEEGAAGIEAMAAASSASGMIDKVNDLNDKLQALDSRVKKLEGGSTPGLPMSENFKRFGSDMKRLTKKIP